MVHLDHTLAGDPALFSSLLLSLSFIYLFIYLVGWCLPLSQFSLAVQWAAPELEHVESRAGDGEFAAVFI